MRAVRKAFTLVELLVVIGIIALLVGILLPALGRAREQANTIKCASNLRQIGQAFAQYLTENQDTFPPSNFYTGLQMGGAPNPNAPSYGYTHWSALINGTKKWQMASDYLNGNSSANYGAPQIAPFVNTSGWEQFQCPSLDNGGLPPANTYPGNNDLGIMNEVTSGPMVDLQAPRLAYTVNEALCPRSYLVAGTYAPSTNVLHPYKFVRSGQVRHSADTILATELWGFQLAAVTDSKINPGTNVSNSRRPVSGFISFGTPVDGLATIANVTGTFVPLNQQYPTYLNYLGLDPSVTLAQGGTPQSELEFVGRNHGQKKYGHVTGSTTGGWDLRLSNFLYVDGHVETKHIVDTISPTFQWGDQMYSLQR
jgi:prepilin-type N-terminal cleavage/methylation domain-containing protein/prepilin-type processing-associated H-X9-DG protein